MSDPALAAAPPASAMTLEELISASRTHRDAERDLARAIDAHKEARKPLDTAIQHQLEETGLDRASGSRGSVAIKETTYARIRPEERPVFFAWLFAHPEAVNLLGNTLNAPALLELEAMGELPPGTYYYTAPTLSFTRRGP